MRAGDALVGRFAIPRHRLRGVFLNSLASGVHGSEIRLRLRLVLIGGLTKPGQRFGVILLHTLATHIREAEVALRNGLPLLGSFAKPVHRLGVAPRNSVTERVHRAQHGLRSGIAALSPRPDDPQGGRVVLAADSGLHVLSRLRRLGDGQTR